MGGVYSYQEQGTRAISVNGTSLYVFGAETGETSPQTERTLLWYMTSTEGDDFYTSNNTMKFRYRAHGYSMQRAGWVAL